MRKIPSIKFYKRHNSYGCSYLEIFYDVFFGRLKYMKVVELGKNELISKKNVSPSLY